MPALFAGGSLCLLLTVNEFGIVLFIGAKGVITLPLLVYDKAIQEFDYTTACVIAVVNVGLSLALYSASIARRAPASEAVVLVWSRSGRAAVWAVAALLLARLLSARRSLVIALASIAGHWNGVLPSDFTLRHYRRRVRRRIRATQLRASLVTGLVASLLALVIGTWAALALRASGRPVRPRARPPLLHAERRPVGLRRPRPARRLQPAAGAAQRHDRDRLRRPLHPDLGLHLSATSPPACRASRPNTSRSPRASARGPPTGSCRVTLAADRALSHRRLQPQLRPVDGRTRRDRHGLSAGLGDPAGRHLRADRPRRDFRRRRADR